MSSFPSFQFILHIITRDIVAGKYQFWLLVGGVSLNCFMIIITHNVLTQRIFPSAWLVLLFKAPLSTCGWNEEINTSPAQGLPFLKIFIRLTVFSLSFFTSPHLGSIKEPGIQTQRRWLFWVINLPSSYSASYPSKVTFLASAPILLDL